MCLSGLRRYQITLPGVLCVCVCEFGSAMDGIQTGQGNILILYGYCDMRLNIVLDIRCSYILKPNKRCPFLVLKAELQQSDAIF